MAHSGENALTPGGNPKLTSLTTHCDEQHRFWGDHSKKGQAGTAIFSKVKPVNVTRGFQESEEVSAADSEGRMVTLEFENSYLVGTCAWYRFCFGRGEGD